MTAKTAAIIIGLAFLAAGLLGFVENPIIGEADNAIFYTDTVHNFVHLISGALFIIIALLAPAFAKTFSVLFGLVYLGLGILGMLTIGSDGMTKLLGFLHVNGKDNYLHIGLGIGILFLGLISRNVHRRETPRTS